MAAKDEPSFGERVSRQRKAAGSTQVALVAELGISQRTGIYYESPAATPANLLAAGRRSAERVDR